MQTPHLVLWLDQHEAKVIRILPDKVEESVVKTEHHVHRHPKGGSEEKSHPADAKHYFDRIAAHLVEAAEILVVGPGTAKLELLKHLGKHHHTLSERVVAVETVDHPSDGQLVAYARTYFSRLDNAHGRGGNPTPS